MLNERKEKKANTLSHLISLGIFIIMGALLLFKGWKHDSMPLNASLITFVIAEIMMFSSSTLYHNADNPDKKKKLRYFDHSSIYISIAGSYTPILVWAVGGTLGTVILIITWLLVIGGILYKIFALGKHPRLSLAIYLIMGWMVVFFAKPVYETLPASSLFCLLGEGIAFSLGTYFFWKDDDHSYYHMIWHIFTFAGCLCHWFILWFML
jgi:hemolysin III